MTSISFTRDSALYTITHQTPAAVYRYINPTDIYDAISGPWPGLDVLQSDRAIDYLSVAIGIHSRLVTSPMKIAGDDIRRAAVYLYEDYRFLNLSDIVLCLKMGIRGELGPSYGRYDAQVLYDWFYTYNNLRNQALRLSSARQSQ